MRYVFVESISERTCLRDGQTQIGIVVQDTDGYEMFVPLAVRPEEMENLLSFLLIGPSSADKPPEQAPDIQKAWAPGQEPVSSALDPMMVDNDRNLYSYHDTGTVEEAVSEVYDIEQM